MITYSQSIFRMQDNLVPLYNRSVHMYVVILINIFFIYEIIRSFLTIFDQILVIFHGWVFFSGKIDTFSGFEGTENVSIFPGRLYPDIGF